MNLLLALSLIAAAGAAACRRSPPAETGAASLATLAASDVITVSEQPIRSGPRITGQLEPAQSAQLRAEVSGAMRSVQVEIGQRVRRGQLLGRIDAGAARDAYQSARTALQSARTQVEIAGHQARRTERLVRAGALAEREREVAQNALVTAQAQLAEARARPETAAEQLERTTLRAPFAGVVSERAVSAGDVVSQGALLFTVVDPSSLRLEALVPPAAAPALTLRTPVEFEVQGYPDRTFSGQVVRVSPAADPASRQIPILVSLANPGGRLFAGLFASGRIATEQRRGLVIPLEALDTSSDQPTVTRLRQGVVERVPVRPGLRDDIDQKVEIRSGVSTGDRLLVGAARGLAPGTRVRLAQPQAHLPAP